MSVQEDVHFTIIVAGHPQFIISFLAILKYNKNSKMSRLLTVIPNKPECFSERLVLVLVLVLILVLVFVLVLVHVLVIVFLHCDLGLGLELGPNTLTWD